MLQKIVVTFDRLTEHTLSRYVHTLDQVELDSQRTLSISIMPVSVLAAIFADLALVKSLLILTSGRLANSDSARGLLA